MILKKLQFLISYYILYRMNSVKYLRSLGAKIGQNCDIITHVKNFGSEPWLIEIGDSITITQGVVFITHDGSSRLFRKRYPEMSRFGNRFGTIKINSNSFIGVNSIIMPGVEIGPDSIVGTGSIVTKTVPPNTVVAGNPAKMICSLEEYIKRYQAKMITIRSTNRDDLRKELTEIFWGKNR